MKITIIYDNQAYRRDLEADWGFSALVEAHGEKILFDTGRRGDILMTNMEKLMIDPRDINGIFISHPHGDHLGGLETFLQVNGAVKVYFPASCPSLTKFEAIKIKGPLKLHEGIFSTGELSGIEQSLVLRSKHGLVLMVGCSHPGVECIIRAASQFGDVRTIIGGLHGFKDMDKICDLDLICPTHCTAHISLIRSLYPEKYVMGGAGRVIEIPE